MSELTLVRSKILVPSPASLLHRPRVYQTIERGLECKLTLVSAPAGYGKTSALVGFAHHSPMPVCWYTADERDRDLGAFIGYLMGAIRERFPRFGHCVLPGHGNDGQVGPGVAARCAAKGARLHGSAALSTLRS